MAITAVWGEAQQQQRVSQEYKRVPHHNEAVGFFIDGRALSKTPDTTSVHDCQN
jgi:hypothetical protein